MSSFKKKQLEKPKRVCLRLRELRQSKKVSLSEMAKRTRINKAHLLAIEECRFEDLPFAAVYKKNFIKRYLEVLGEDPDQLLAQYAEEELKYTESPDTHYHPRKRVRMPIFHCLPSVFRYVGVLAITVALIGYLGFQVKQIIDPPQLVLYSPQNGKVVHSNMLSVQGATEKDVEVTINGTQINKDEAGYFKEEIPLSEGINPITVTAIKKHGKTTEETRYVIYNVPETELSLRE